MSPPMNSTPTLLGIFAHPDDESFGPGGTLARYAAEGVNVHVIIATDGIAGSVEDESYRQTHESLAQVRSTELANAALALGITTIWSFPYRDSGMRGAPENQHPQALIQQPIEQLMAEISEYIQRLRPDVIITHDPFGGYGHPDHIRCCEATTAAFYAQLSNIETGNGSQKSRPISAHRARKLYYTAFDKRLLKLIVRLMPLWGKDPTAIGRNKDIDLVEISQWDTPVHARIDVAEYLAQKHQASIAHASQYSGGPAFVRVLPPFLRRRFLATDSYTRAYPEPTSVIETDLFEGI